jgi:hypothetical protein
MYHHKMEKPMRTPMLQELFDDNKSSLLQP